VLHSLKIIIEFYYLKVTHGVRDHQAVMNHLQFFVM
jgi:hypothetical protein